MQHKQSHKGLARACLWCGCLLWIFAEQAWSDGGSPSSSECPLLSTGIHLPDILAGKAEPYAFTGPSPDCTAEGCKHLYWGPRCRFSGDHPRCPLETRRELLRMLKEYAGNGAEWAKSALGLQPCELWQAVKGRTVWFVGDSISQETAGAMLCFLVEYHVTHDAPPLTDDPNLMHQLTHNANMKEMTTWCHALMDDTRICMLRANFGPRMAAVMLPALTRLTNDDDIVILNFGLWSNTLTELELHTSFFKASFRYYMHKLPRRTFWRETTAQHYDSLSGMYDTGIPIQNQRCVPAFPGVNITIDSSGALIPMPGMSLPKNWSPEEWELNTMLAGGHRNNATQATVDDLGLYTIRTWNTSMALAGFHHHVHDSNDQQVCAKIDCDCTHACQPSWSQMWLPEFTKAFSSPELWLDRPSTSQATTS